MSNDASWAQPFCITPHPTPKTKQLFITVRNTMYLHRFELGLV